MTLWIDVEDLFYYSTLGARPSGIQRLTYEMYAALKRLAGPQVRFIRHTREGTGYHQISWEEVSDVYHRIAHDPRHGAVLSAPQPRIEHEIRKSSLRGALGRLAHYVPPSVRTPLREVVRAKFVAFRAAGRAIGALGATTTAYVRTQLTSEAPAEAGSDIPTLADAAAPGDVLCVFGAPWVHADIEARVDAAKRELGLSVALLIYDLIPVVRPEFVLPTMTDRFDRCYATLISVADHVFAISKATAHDIHDWASRSGTRLSHVAVAIPIGTGFSHSGLGLHSLDFPIALPGGLKDRGFVLFVSTIEARKNHDLVFRAWRILLEQMPFERVPTLVFAGRVGWMVADLMQKIENSRRLMGKLVIIEGPTDSELASLYAGCRFTVFPSLYEGWGLPVTESLTFGRTCIASDRTSVPEAGGEFCLYIDPDNITAATATLRRAIEDQNVVAELERKIANAFRPVSWDRTAHALLEHLAPDRPARG